MPETRQQVRDAVAARRPVDARERTSIDAFLTHFDTLDQPFSEGANPVHVTGSAIVVTEDRSRVLLHQHKRLGLWLQPGGHIDDGELPWEGSLREVIEETGLPATLVVGDGDGVPELVHLDVHPGPRKHTHLDLRYLVQSPHVAPTPPPGESQQVQWFQWHQAIAITEPGLEGALRALQPGRPKWRTARVADASECGYVYLRSRDFGLPEVPYAHPRGDVKRWMADDLVGHTDMWVAELDGVITGFLVLSHDRDGSWLEHLYLDPSWIGRGLGDEAIELARGRCSGGMQLWAFQSNERARRFYERHGFVAEDFTDGQGNEERTPDVRYRWTP